MKTIKLIVNTKSETYPIFIGSKLVTKLLRILKQNSINFNKCLFVIDKKVPKKMISKINQSMKNKKCFKYFLLLKKKIKIKKMLTIY